jgi:peptidyl-prolyl cis-trans isomerase C
MKLPILCAAGLLAISSVACAADNIAVVNGQAIPKSLEDTWVKELVANGGADTPEARAQIKNNLIAGAVIEQEAKKLGIDKSPSIQFGIQYAKFRLLQDALVRDYMKKHPVSEADMKAFYEAEVGKLDKQQFNVRHILVKDQKTAQDLLAKIKGGEDFEALAKQNSLDEGSKETGGNLGWAGPSNFVKPFADALTKMKKGEISSEPVQTQFGWHIISVQDVRPQEVPSFEQTKKEIAQVLEQRQRADYLQKLISSQKIEYPNQK